jgi:hypothetical protein
LEHAEKGIVTAMSIKMHAEIVSYGNGSLRGELHSKYLETPYEFTSLLRMIEKMEEIFDTVGFPEKFMKPRTFADEKKVKKKLETERDYAISDIILQAIDKEMGGAKCTFEISVRFRQHATWQGEITWVEKNLMQYFRSVLEMLKLIDEALMDGVEELGQVEWKD